MKRLWEKALAAALCAAVAAGFCRLPARAVDIGTDIPPVGVGSVQLEDKTYYLVDDTGKPVTDGASPEDYNVYLDSDTLTLTLKNAQLKDTLYVPGGISVLFDGANSIVSGTGIQVTSDGGITAEGDGSVEMTVSTEGICISKKLTGDIVIQGNAALTIHNQQSAGIYTGNGGITIGGHAVVKFTERSGSAMSCAEDVVICGSASVTAANPISAGNKIVISDSAAVDVTVNSGTALSGPKGVGILGGANVTACGPEGGINAFYGPVEISGTADISSTNSGNAAISVGLSQLDDYYSVTVSGTLTLSGFVGIGIRHGDIIIDGGTVKVVQSNYGLYPVEEGNVKIINQADVTINADTYGIHPKNGGITISDSTVRSGGGSQSFTKAPSLDSQSFYRIYAGTDAEQAELIAPDALTDETFTGNQYVKIEPYGHVTGVSLDRRALSLSVGGTAVLTAAITPSDAVNQSVVWTSGNPSVAAVDNGTVTAVGAGTTDVTVTTADGGKTAVCTVTVAAPAPDGGSSGGSGSGTTTTTVRNEDGSTTTTKTDKATGTVTETTRTADGTTAVVETKADGTVTETVKRPDGTQGTTTVSAEGGFRAEAVVSPKAAEAAGRSGETVRLPLSGIRAAADRAAAPLVEVRLPERAAPVKVEIPVAQVTPGTVLVLVKEDGSEEILKTTVLTEAGVCAALESSAALKVVDNSKDFADVAPVAAWAGDAIGFVTARELFAGVSETAFAPSAPMTRAMLVTVLHRLENEPRADVSLDAFSDADAVPGWSADAMAWGVAGGIVTGDGAALSPTGEITREQLAAILYRYAGSPDVSGTSLDGFADAPLVGAWARDAVQWAVEQGLITGRDGSRLAPADSATRAEVSAVLMRFLYL